MKKRLSILLLATTAALLLSSCASKPDNPPSTGTPQGSAQQVSADGSAVGLYLNQNDIIDSAGTGEPETSQQYELYNEPGHSADSSSCELSTNFQSVAGNGKIIRIWYQNNADVGVTIFLQKYNTDSKAYDDVMAFRVKANTDGWNEYIDDYADAGTYRLLIQADSGGNIACAYRVVQATESAKQ